jgi:hypothetical protein
LIFSSTLATLIFFIVSKNDVSDVVAWCRTGTKEADRHVDPRRFAHHHDHVIAFHFFRTSPWASFHDTGFPPPTVTFIV